jgi:type II secretory pathway pseudopilin PulG
MRNGDRRVRREAGFTYVGLIVTVAIIGLVGAATLKADALLRRAAAERELLETGAAFGDALKSYADATPRGQPAQPPTLQELLKDPRYPGVRRHLRRIFVDPVTGKAEWGIVWANPGNQTGVLAVYSLSQATPLKLANFDARFSGFENKEHLSEWKFAALGQAVVAPGQGPGQPPQAQPGQPSLFPPAGQPAPAQGSLFPTPGEQPPIPPATPPPPEPPAPADRSPPVETEAETPAPPEPAEAAGDGNQEEGKDVKDTGRR